MRLKQRIKVCFEGFVEDGAFESAAAISFYAITSLPPLVVLTVSLGGMLVNDESLQSYLIVQANSMFGPSAAEVISLILVSSQEGSHGVAALVGLGTLLLTAGGLHAQLQASLNKIWNIERKPTPFLKRFLGDRLLATLTIIGTGVLLIASLFFSTLVRLASTWLNSALSMEFISFEKTQAFTTFFLLAAMVALLFRLLPDARVAWRDVWKGAFLTSALFALSRHLMAFYLAKTSFSVSYGQAGTVVLLLLWIYFSALIFLFGAEWTSVEAGIRGRHIVARNPGLKAQVIAGMQQFPTAKQVVESKDP